VIAAVAHLVDVGALRRLRRADQTDFILAILCFAGVLVFGLLIGLAIAVVVSLLALVYRAFRPGYAILGRAPGAVDDERLRYRGVEDHPDCETFPGIVILRIDGELFFANARWFPRDRCARWCATGLLPCARCSCTPAPCRTSTARRRPCSRS